MKSELFINGEWVAAQSGEMINVINPATEEIFHSVASAGADDVDAAVQAAKNAFNTGPWANMNGMERAVILRKIAGEIEARTDELARLEVLDNGKPFPEAQWDMEDTAGCFSFYANLAEELHNAPDAEIALGDERFKTHVVKEPVGVVAAIVPWNYPLLMASWKVAPALAAGCTIVLKPSEVTSLTALELGQIAKECGLPDGVLNIVTGYGASAGQPLSEHRDVDKIAFTGSVATGSRVMQSAASDIKNLSLELGGKSPFVVFGDSDLDQAVEWIMFGIFWNQGEVCSATSRVLVEETIYEKLLARLKEETQKITIGNGMNEGVLLGPIVNKKQYDQVLGYISAGIKDGARLITGGDKPALNKGYFIKPTIFADVDENSSIWREEIFGPVVCVKSFNKESEAIRLANDSEFGLAAAVMSKDNARCERVARAFRAGIVWINCSQPTFVEAPWGGYKKSGIGRELGKWGLENYLETKQITRFDGNSPWGWYLK
ncbi:Aldehyde dehydrogenase [hydrothermal vent metagenome]|uniref:Aldehyde dehydrogenase n=1 Tax=hydrothermal vent metagenome TaxID=652676 RepID=A0A3B0TCQ3_9ZZZZ